MPIVQNITGQILDDVYVLEAKSPPNIQGIPTGIVKMVGTFSKGIPGAVYNISNYTDAVRQLGLSSLYVDGPICVQSLINQGCGGIKVVPIFGADAKAASITLKDAQEPPGDVLTLTAAQTHPQTGVITEVVGNECNKIIVTVTNAENKFSLTIQFGNIVETYSRLTLDDMLSAINSAESSLVIASLPDNPSTALPKAATFALSGGTNGTVNTSDFIGVVDNKGNRTGLKALETIEGNFVFAANQSTDEINSAIAAHAVACNCIGLVCAAVNSTVDGTIVTKGNLSQDNVVFCDGWRIVFDADSNNTNRNVTPAALVAGMASQNPVHKSWGNKPIYATLAAVTPRSKDELSILQRSGVLCVCNNIPRGGVGTRSGISSDGSDIYVRSMRNFIELSVNKSLGWAVDEMQSSDPKDPLRTKIKQSLDAFFIFLANPLDRANKMIDSYLTVCDLSNNTQQDIQSGKLNVSVRVRLLGSAKQIVISADISQGTITTISQYS